MKKIVIIASTSGSVMLKTLVIEEIRKSIYMVVSDRQCGAIEVAKSYNIKTMILHSNTGSQFSKNLLNFFEKENIDIFISFYTRLFSGEFLKEYKNKVYNFHPSLLPANPGMHGFEDTISSGAKYMGTTLHLIDKGVDTGKPVIQSISPLKPSLSESENRHIIFLQQCKIFIQFILWIKENRVYEGNIKNARYNFEQFCPNLESSLAIDFSVDLLG